MIAEKHRKFAVWQNDIRNVTKKRQYHEMRSKVQHHVREMKNHWWEQKASEMQALRDTNNSRAFFAAAKTVYGPVSQGVRPAVDKDGVLLKDIAGICNRWREHFCELLFNLFRLRAKMLIIHMTILELQYANDNAIVVNTEEDLEAAMNVFSYAYNALGLTLNAQKTKVLFQPSPDSTHDQYLSEITAGGQCLDTVDHFTYLNSRLSSKADVEIQACPT